MILLKYSKRKHGLTYASKAESRRFEAGQAPLSFQNSSAKINWKITAEGNHRGDACKAI